jgi:hypothetical protein
MIQVRKFFHRNDYQIGILFGFDEELKQKARSIGARWSQTNRCWYVLYNKENYRKIIHTFGEVEIIDYENNKLQPEPAETRHEIVHIADTISEIQPPIQVEHKGLDPAFARSIVYLGINGRYWILRVPYNKIFLAKLLDIKGVFWNKRQKAFFVLRHVNVKIKVEALFDIGEIFPP